jgi:hypothetical protein
MSSIEYDQFIPINLFEIFDDKDLESAISALRSVISSYDQKNIKFKTVKSELGSGLLVYLAIPQMEIDSNTALEQKQSFYAAKRKSMLDDNLNEWENLKNQFSK